MFAAQYFTSSGLNVKPATQDQLDECELQHDKLKRLFHEEKHFDEKNIRIYFGQHFTIDTGKYLPWLIESLKILKHK